MLKQISRLFRDHLERKIFNRKDKVDYSVKVDRSRRHYRYKHGEYSVNVRSFCKNFYLRQLLRNVDAGHEEEKEKTEACNTSDYLKYNSWFEAFGLSSTFAFAYTLNQNFHVRRRKFIESRSGYDAINEACIFKKLLYSQVLWKKFTPRHVLTQPPALQSVNSLPVFSVTERQDLPVYGPQTANEVVNEAMDGVRRAHNFAIGELENRLGLRYMTKKRYRKAVVHFSAGMALENSSAACNLAQCYELGLGTSQDFVLAAKCYNRASDLGNATAMYNLAIFYVHGWGGLKPDRAKAEELMRRASDLGEPNAKAVWESRLKKNAPLVDSHFNFTEQQRVKEVREVVDSVMRSTLEVYQLPYSKSSEASSDNSTSTCSSISRSSVLFSEFDLSDSSANYYSGICYEHGIGVKQNFNNAVKHYSSAAFSGNSQALYNLAACYETTAGSSLTDSYQIPLLIELYKMAADHGHQFATERLKTLEIHEVLGTLKDFFSHSKPADRSQVIMH